MAHSVSTFYLNHFVLLAPYLNLDLCPNLNQLLLSSFSTIHFSHSAATTCFFLPKQQWWTPFIPKFSAGILYVHCPSYLIFLVVGHNPTKGIKAQAEYKILYPILYSSMNGIGSFLGIIQVQNFCSRSILNSDPVPCTYVCFEPVLHMEPHPKFPRHSWLFPILVLYHMHIFLSLSTYIEHYSLDYGILIAMAESSAFRLVTTTG